MPDLVYMKGGRVAAGEVVGQGCLAEVTNATQAWIFDDQSAAGSEAAAGVGAGTLYPVGFTDVDHLMGVYWRWKKMQWEVEWVDEDQSYSNTDHEERSGLTREADMVLPSPWNIGASDPLASTDIRIFRDPSSSATKVVKYYNNKYYPLLQVEIWTLDFPEFAISSYSTYTDSAIYSEYGTFNGTITTSDATTYNIPLSYHSAYDPTTRDVTIEASEYWAHKKPDGTAKWNTSTGLPV